MKAFTVVCRVQNCYFGLRCTSDLIYAVSNRLVCLPHTYRLLRLIDFEQELFV